MIRQDARVRGTTSLVDTLPASAAGRSALGGVSALRTQLAPLTRRFDGADEHLADLEPQLIADTDLRIDAILASFL
jgi:hypothetical protein